MIEKHEIRGMESNLFKAELNMYGKVEPKRYLTIGVKDCKGQLDFFKSIELEIDTLQEFVRLLQFSALEFFGIEIKQFIEEE